MTFTVCSTLLDMQLPSGTRIARNEVFGQFGRNDESGDATEKGSHAFHYHCASNHFYDLLGPENRNRYQVEAVTYIAKPAWRERFEACKIEFRQMGLIQEMYAFHGTAEPNIAKIVDQGLRGPKEGIRIRNGNHEGIGLYFAENPNISLNYTKGCNKVFICHLLLGRVHEGVGNPTGYHSNHVQGECRVIYEARQVLPLYIVEFSKCSDV